MLNAMQGQADPSSIAMISAVALVTVAVIGGIISLIGHWINRSNAKLQTRLAANLKLADFRQAWINALREDMAAFQALGVTPGLAHRSEQEFYKLGTRIELRMNPDDPDYDELHGCLYAFLDAETDAEKYAANPAFVAICQSILKREWDALKFEVKTVAR